MTLQVCESDERWMGLARAALQSACKTGSTVHLCLSGGTTPKPLYDRLAKSDDFRALLAERDLHLWVGDERETIANSGLRNSEMIASCFRGLPLTLHLWPLGPREGAASAYEAELEHVRARAYSRLENESRPEEPLFDLVLLGMGEDGHCAGLFSPSDLVPRPRGLVRLTEAPTEPKWRMTLSSEALLSSRKIIVLVQGRSKIRRFMSNLFGEAHDPISIFMRDTTEVIAQL